VIRSPHASRFFASAAALAAALLLSRALPGCGQTVEVGIDDPLMSGGAGGAAGAGNSGGTLELAGIGGSQISGGSSAVGMAGAAACVKVKCRNDYLACGDCKDDDGDGKVDSEDPDCLGPCDNDEKNLSTGSTVGNGAPCRQDCYFDGNAGPGNDKCQWTHQCDTLSVAPDYPPSGEARCAFDESKAPAGTTCADLRTTQDPQCLSTCLPLVPNGCDCFGCCELPAGSNRYRFIGSVRGSAGCELDSNGDPTNCPPCTPVPSCLNECKRCENCVGRGADPDSSCGASVACPPGQAACTTNDQCDFAEYCVTGCCVRPPEPT
jgi:hypothetical protein